MSAMDTSDGPAAEEKKDDPPPPRFEIKKWNAVRSPRPSEPRKVDARRRTEDPGPTPSTRRATSDAKVSRARQRLRAVRQRCVAAAAVARENATRPSETRHDKRHRRAVCMWSWDMRADTCAICRNSLNEPSIEYQANPSPNNENGLSIAFDKAATSSTSTASSAGSKPAVCPLCNKPSGSSRR